MSKRTLLLIVGLFIVTIILFIVALSTNKQTPTPQQQVQVPTPTPFQHTVLSFSPTPLVITAPFSQQSVNVMIDTGDNVATAVELEIGYDPKVLTNVAIGPSTFIQNPLQLTKNIDAKNGRISYAIGITPAGTPHAGSGSVATITFSVLPGVSVQQTKLQFLPKTLVSARGIDSSVLKSSTDEIITLPTNPSGTGIATPAAQQYHSPSTQ